MLFSLLISAIAVAGYFAHRAHASKPTHKTPLPQSVETLKNALLVYSLTKIRPADFDMSPVVPCDYAQFDGCNLPPMSGCSPENALFSYYMDREEFRKDLFYTTTMENKLIAIEKYFAKNLGTDQAITQYLKELMHHDTQGYKTMPSL